MIRNESYEWNKRLVLVLWKLIPVVTFILIELFRAAPDGTAARSSLAEDLQKFRRGVPLCKPLITTGSSLLPAINLR